VVADGRRAILIAAALAAAFAGRLAYGLSMPFWSEDERQVYLIGLRAFARDAWPVLGADVVWTGGQLPGALLGLLIRWPLEVWPAPEAPFVLLNLLSFGALALLAWYLCGRLSDVPRWLIWSALLTLPWTVNVSTHVINTSYVLPISIVFFVGFFEGMPALRRELLPFMVAWACMGAGLLALMQIHMSWVILPPYVVAAAAGVAFGRTGLPKLPRAQVLARAGAGFLMGAAAVSTLLAPTWAAYGPSAGHMFGALQFQAQSPFGLVSTAARVLSFASFETLRFLGLTRAERVLVFWREPWIAPFAAVTLLAGVAQPLWMAATAFRRVERDAREWRRMRVLVVATIGLVYASYFLSVRGPQAHAFSIAFPVAALFAASCWQACARAPGWRRRVWEGTAASVLVCGVVLHAGLAIDRGPRQSLYVDRALVAAAIDHRNDRYLGDRRDTLDVVEDHRPRPADGLADPRAFMLTRPDEDLRLDEAVWRPVRVPFLGTVSTYDVTVTNRSRAAAWLDLRYESVYADAPGRAIATHEGVIKQILQPGETRRWPDLAGNVVPDGAVSASFRLTGAERAIPKR
jgi:hypothetical protein